MRKRRCSRWMRSRIAMDYVPSGDDRGLLNNSGVLKEEYGRFYIGELFSANFLVDGIGHVKRSGYGSTDPQTDEDSHYADSVVGSSDYMVSEVLRGKPYTYSFDFWLLGCILFEFHAGFPPFSSSTPEETPEYDKPEDLVFNLTDVASDAVTCLIAHSSVLYSSPDDLSKHLFFKYIKWDVLRCVRAPFVPALDSETDTGYNDDFSSPEDMAKYSEAEEKYANKGIRRADVLPPLRGAEQYFVLALFHHNFLLLYILASLLFDYHTLVNPPSSLAATLNPYLRERPV
ncbi:hypothetical protein D9619_003565 [Psilocybe cf. subviscida]|uniref:non-specific serine/threonine protein kinase n=1 Tax=Psilocybe cf. subviscida TaxID=2480587 RepID=A0A8H5AWK9_9AGAR|nr:hypothetical protein D9619_003565 [Psilocybe cf. subviscida]